MVGPAGWQLPSAGSWHHSVLVSADIKAFLVIDTLILIVFLTIAVFIDCRRHKIPNLLTGAGLAIGLTLAAVPALSPITLTSSTLGVLAGFCFLIPGYLLGKMGAGDVKLLAMAGSFLGLSGTVTAGLATLITGGFVALCWLAYQQMLKPALAAFLAARSSDPEPAGLAAYEQLLSGYLGLRHSTDELFAADRDTVWKSRFPFALAIAVGCLSAIALTHSGVSLNWKV